MSGTLHTWGESDRGQLGNGTTTPDVTAPAQIGSDDTWSAISASKDEGHAVALKSAGTLWTWGESANGRLGNGTITPDVTAPAQIGSDTDWSKATTGYYHTLAIKSGGTLWGFGFNNNGQLGDASTTQRTTPTQIGVATDWAQVSGGANFSAGIKTGGTLWTWGADGVGQLGNGAPTSDVTSPAQIGVATDWAQVSCGGTHAAAVTTGGKLYTWGENANGQLGQGDTTIRAVPTQVGAGTDWESVSCGGFHTLAIKTDGTLWACGANDAKQLGDGTTTQRESFVQIGVATDWAQVSAGRNHSFALKDDGTLYAWGGAGSGALGNGTTTPDVGAPTQIGASEWELISAGAFFSVGVQAVIPPPNAFWTAFVGTEEVLV